jgi:hypothetical protein
MMCVLTRCSQCNFCRIVGSFVLAGCVLTYCIRDLDPKYVKLNRLYRRETKAKHAFLVHLTFSPRRFLQLLACTTLPLQDLFKDPCY